MLSKRFKYNGKSVLELNKLQLYIKKQIEKEIEEGIYSFEKVPCCICGGNDFEILSEKDRYGLYAQIVICKNCGLIQMSPRMTQEAYNQFYDMEYRKLYIGKKGAIQNSFMKQYQRGKKIYNYLEKNLKINIDNLKVLEIGTGTGGILYYFKEMGNEICGCDLDSEHIRFGKEQYGLNLINGTIADVKTKKIFDIVICSHILEHLFNPMDELIQIKSFMGKNSYLYIEVPCLKNIKKYFGGDFLLWIHIAHLYYFTLKTLGNHMRIAGYDLICADNISTIRSIFKKSFKKTDSNNLKGRYNNDYFNSISFLRKMEFYRFLPTAYNIKRVTMPMLINFLKQIGLYNVTKKIYHKFKN